MHEYSTRRVWTLSNYFFELESNTRYFELFNIIRTTRIRWNYSDQMNYSDMIELLDLVELFEPVRTVRPESEYSVLANCLNQVGLFDLCRRIFLFFLFIYLFNFNKNKCLFNEIILKIKKIVFCHLLWNKYLSYK